MTGADGRSTWLDAARACAALLVFSAHARGIFLPPWRTSVGLVAYGAATDVGLRPSHQAVIVFFVLSGFFVGGSVLRHVSKGNWSWRLYLSQRLTRLWLVLVPALVLTVLLDMAGRHFAPSESVYTAVPGPVSIGPLDLTTFLGNAFFLQGILTRLLGTNSPLWSLSYEFWYYMAFPLLMLGIAVRQMAIVRAASLFALGALFFFVGSTIAAYFLIWLLGVVPHLVVPLRRPVPSWALVASAGLVVLAALGLIKSGIGMISADLLLAVLFSGWCYLAKNAAPVDPRGFFARLSAGFAAFSYTLYLVHVPALFFLSALLVGPWHPLAPSPLHLAEFAALWGCVLLYAFAIYWLFERNTAAVQAWVGRTWFSHSGKVS